MYYIQPPEQFITKFLFIRPCEGQGNELVMALLFFFLISHPSTNNPWDTAPPFSNHSGMTYTTDELLGLFAMSLKHCSDNIFSCLYVFCSFIRKDVVMLTRTVNTKHTQMQ